MQWTNELSKSNYISTQFQDKSITLEKYQIERIKVFLSKINTENNDTIESHPLHKNNLADFINPSFNHFRGMFSLVTSFAHNFD